MVAAGALIALLIGRAVAAVEAGSTLLSVLWFAAIFAVAIGYAVLETRARR